MSLKARIGIAVLNVAIIGGLVTGAVSIGIATADPIIDISDGRPLLALADGSAAAIVESAPPAATPEPNVLHDLSKLRDAYEAIKANEDKSKRVILYAALFALLLKLLLSGVNVALTRYGKTNKWLSWVALGLAVPIALLSHYALGYSWLDSMIWAGSGPGAVIVHELVKSLSKGKGGK